MSFPVNTSHILTRVPCEDVVASMRPDGGNDNTVSAPLCAAIIEIGCLVGGAGNFRGGVGGGGPVGTGGGHGGR
jgi:hypothetical protein